MLEKTLESPLDCKEIQPVHPKGNQPWIFIGKTDAEAGAPILWPPHVKSWLTGKDPDAGRYLGQEEKEREEDEMVGWHHWLDSNEWRVNSGNWWWTGRPGMLQSKQWQSQTWLRNWTEHLLQVSANEGDIRDMTLMQRVRHNWSNLACMHTKIRTSQVASGKESTCQCRRYKRYGLGPWFRKISWSRK